jgi:hypothetical protein
VATTELGRFARGLLVVAACAFAAHAAAYGSLWPEAGKHGYFAWYAPALAVLSAVSLVALPLALALSFLSGNEPRVVRAVAGLLPSRRPERSLAREVGGLASRGLLFLGIQETIERSLFAGRLEPVSFDARAWLLLAVTLALFALMATLVERVMVSLVEGTRSRQVALPGPLRPRLAGGCVRVTRRRSLLAVHGALRAPPAFS